MKEILTLLSVIVILVQLYLSYKKKAAKDEEQQNKSRTALQQRLERPPSVNPYGTPMTKTQINKAKPPAAAAIGKQAANTTTEGQCIEENPNHCVTEHLTENTIEVNALSHLLELDSPQNLRKAIILSEILGKPKALR